MYAKGYSNFDSLRASKPQFKSTSNSDKLLNVHNKVKEELQDWIETPSGVLGKVKKLLSKIKICEAKKKTSAATPYQFKSIEDVDKERLEKKLKLNKTITIVCTVVALAFLTIALLGPLVATPIFMVLPLSVASTAIIGTTVIGLAGVAIVISSLFITNTASLRKLRVAADPKFQNFINNLLQYSFLAFYPTEEHIVDKKLHQIYLDSRNNIEPFAR